MEDNLKILKMKLSDTKIKQDLFKKKLEETLKKKINLGITNKSIGFIQSTINFFKSEFFKFMYKYLIIPTWRVPRGHSRFRRLRG